MTRIIFLLIFIPVLGLSQIKKNDTPVNPIKKQVEDSLVFKGVNKLLISNERSFNQNLALLQTALLNRGYDVRINRKAGTISTLDSVINGGSLNYVFNAIIANNRIELSGKYLIKVSTTPLRAVEDTFNYDIRYVGSEHGDAKKLFGFLLNIAKDIEGKITYIDETRKKRSSIF